MDPKIDQELELIIKEKKVIRWKSRGWWSRENKCDSAAAKPFL